MTSPSQKSDSASRRHPKLSRTLKRKPGFTPIGDGDYKYLWAAYKLDREHNPDLTVDEFKQRLLVYLSGKSVAYSVTANTAKGRIPVGMITGIFVGPVLNLDEVQWYPWASVRNKYETTVHALNEIRKLYVAMFLSPMKDKEFFVKIAQHGVIRRVGTVHDTFSDGPAALFQTRQQK